MSILSKIVRQSNERRVFFHRIQIFPETLEKIEELREILEDKADRYSKNGIQQAEIFRKIIGIAYHDIKHDMGNNGKINKYIKFITTKKNGRKKKLIKEYCLKRATI
jgi:hypothetical protein